jgi:predicted MFS family arabinose efflux permease
MFSRQVKKGVFILEGLNSFAMTYYIYYFYFFTEKKFGFGNKTNLILAAIAGLVYVPAAIFGGRFGQRAGYFKGLKVGFIVMMTALSVGLFVDSPAGQIAVMLVTNIGMCFTWPTLEALASEGESYDGLQRSIGIYNIVWAGTAALAYFCGGAMLDKFGLNSMFYVPITVQLVQLGLTFWLENKTRHESRQPAPVARTEEAKVSGELNPRPIAKARGFLRMAWLANPFSYIAANTLIAVMPGVANRLGLSTTLAGVYCSLWCFARMGAFFGLWFWPSWHYRFRWLLGAYLALIGTFAMILMIPNLVIVMAAQLILGGALGLIYYSSLFYSMDVGDTKGDHGGIHEAMIGLGQCVGPAVGAISLQVWPQYPNSGAIAVSMLLLCGLGGLLGIWRNTKT